MQSAHHSGSSDIAAARMRSVSGVRDEPCSGPAGNAENVTALRKVMRWIGQPLRGK